MNKTISLQRCLLAVLVAVLGLGMASAAQAAAATDIVGPQQANFLSAFAYSEQNPTADPPGANDWTCKPTAAHPYPVVLVHGTFENKYDNWASLSPQLKQLGYCVFALNYGGDQGSVIQGNNEIAASAVQLAAFVSQVLTATGKSKVDLVGHSQGGMMPRYYIKNLGGGTTVDKLVGLVPSNHGTTLDGLANLATAIPIVGTILSVPCEACTEQIQGSAFITTLNSGSETNPAVKYTVISTKYDEVVTPYTSAFLAAGPNVTNETVQDFCPADLSDHINIPYDTPATQLVENALDPAHSKAPAC